MVVEQAVVLLDQEDLQLNLLKQEIQDHLVKVLLEEMLLLLVLKLVVAAVQVELV